MYGYRQPMEADFVRDSVTPLDTTKKLTIAINPYDEKVKSLSYEVRTSDGTKIVENRKIKDLDSSGSDGYLRADRNQLRSFDESGVFHAADGRYK